MNVGDDEFASMLSSNVRMITLIPNYGTTIFGLLLAAGLLLILVAFFGVIISKSKVNSTKFEKRGLNFFFLHFYSDGEIKTWNKLPSVFSNFFLFFAHRR